MLKRALEETIKDTTGGKTNKISKKTGKFQAKPPPGPVDEKRQKRIEQRRLRRAKKKVACITNNFHYVQQIGLLQMSQVRTLVQRLP